MDEIVEYLLASQPPAVQRRDEAGHRSAAVPGSLPAPSLPDDADAIGTLHRLLRDKNVLSALLRLAGAK